MRRKLETLRTPLRVQQAEERLRRYLLDGPLKPGDCLPPEMELCAQLGIGRSTLREAVGVLEWQGLVQRRHGVGVEVSDRCDQAAGEMLALLIERQHAPQDHLIEIRRLVEVQAAAWAANRATDEDREEIQAALEEMASSSTPESFAQGDLRFHLAIARAAHNVVLQSMISAVRELLYDEIMATLKTDFRPQMSREYHVAVFNGIEAHDPELASGAMIDHLGDTERMLRRGASSRGKKKVSS